MELSTNVHDCALVFEGGGYRAGYTAGMADVLLENEIFFPFVCGLSAGASNTVNYLSRDRWRTRWAFTELAGDPRAGGTRSMLRGNGYINADYCYRGLIDQDIAPFDWETFSHNPADLRIQAFERDTGRTVIWGRKDIRTVHDLIDRVRASSTLPVLMKPITVDGSVMLDGGLGKGAGLPLWMAEDAGYEKFLFLTTRERGYTKKPFVGGSRRVVMHATEGYPLFRAAMLTRADRYNDEMRRIEQLEQEGRCLIVRPDVMEVESTTFDVARLEASFERGREQALRELDRWLEFIAL